MSCKCRTIPLSTGAREQVGLVVRRDYEMFEIAVGMRRDWGHLIIGETHSVSLLRELIKLSLSEKMPQIGLQPLRVFKSNKPPSCSRIY